MAGSGKYKSYVRADAQLLETGYRKIYLNLLTDFTTLQDPDALTVDSVTGDGKKISTEHVWAAGKAPMSMYVNKKSLEAPGETVGEPGSLKMKYTLKFFMKGDGPVSQDMMENLLNEDLIAFVEDGCPDGQVIQYGDDCDPGEVQKSSFSSGTLPSGEKGFSFEVDFYTRLFYMNELPAAR